MNDDAAQRIAKLEAQVELLSRMVGNGDAKSPVAAPGEQITYGDALAKALTALEPLRGLLDDPTVNDILINSPNSIYIERAGKLIKSDVTFPNDSEVFKLAQAIAAQIGREVPSRRPLLDARLPDGSRVNVIAPPLAVDATAISIRKFSTRELTLDVMAEQGNMSKSLAEFLKIAGRCRLNMIVSGGTGSGKTTLLNALSRHIDMDERVVTIEDAAELRLQQPHVVRLETRPVSSGIAREDEVTIRDLMKNALRMRPDRILIGEVRGSEAFDMMQAMNTGHEGSLTTIHANHPRDALARLENMINMANLKLPNNAIRSQVASAVNLIVQISRMRDGHRRITYVSEIVGMESDIITMQELYSYQSKGEGPDGKLIGDFKWSGIVPRFLRRAAYYGEAEHLAEALGTKLPKL